MGKRGCYFLTALAAIAVLAIYLLAAPIVALATSWFTTQSFIVISTVALILLISLYKYVLWEISLLGKNG